MKWMFAMMVTTLLLTRAHCQPQHKTHNAERQKRSDTRKDRNILPLFAGLEDLQHHTLLNLVGIGRSEVNSALNVLGTLFNFVDIYGRPRYPVLDNNNEWFRWVDRNLPLVLNTYMAPAEVDPLDYYGEEYEEYLFRPHSDKATSTRGVIWQDFYKNIYMDMISPNRKSSRSGATSRQDGYCLNGMSPGYSSVEVDVMGQMFKYLADNTVTPVYEFVMGRDRQRSHMMQVDPLYTLSEHLAYFVGLSEGDDSYRLYESKIDEADYSDYPDYTDACIDSTARVMNTVMPYGPFLTMSNLAAVGVWLIAFWAPFLGL